MSGVTGEFIERPINLHAEWHISNFLSLTKEVDTSYQSRDFFYSDAVWRLEMYPNGQSKNNTEGHIGLYMLRRDGGLPKIMSFSFGIKIKDKERHLRTTGYRLFSEKKVSWGLDKLLQTSELLSGLDPDTSGTLIVTCKLVAHPENLSTSVPLFRRLWNMSLGMSDILVTRKKTDIVFKLKDEEIPAHRMIVQGSTIFNRMFDVDVTESETGEVNIEGIDKDVFMVILAFAYSGVPKGLCSANAHELYKVAHKYDIQELKELFAEFMRGCLSVDTVCDVIATAISYEMENLKKCAKDYFYKNKEEVFKTENWKTLKRENLALSCEVLEYILREDC